MKNDEFELSRSCFIPARGSEFFRSLPGGDRPLPMRELTSAYLVVERLDALERQNRQLRVGFLAVVAVLSLGVVALFVTSAANAQVPRVISTEGLIIQKNGVRYGSFGLNTDNDVIFEMRRQGADGWRMIYGYVSGDTSQFLVAGPGDGAASVLLRSHNDGSGGIDVRRPGTYDNVWSAP